MIMIIIITINNSIKKKTQSLYRPDSHLISILSLSLSLSHHNPFFNTFSNTSICCPFLTSFSNNSEFIQCKLMFPIPISWNLLSPRPAIVFLFYCFVYPVDFYIYIGQWVCSFVFKKTFLIHVDKVNHSIPSISLFKKMDVTSTWFIVYSFISLDMIKIL